MSGLILAGLSILILAFVVAHALGRCVEAFLDYRAQRALAAFRARQLVRSVREDLQ